MKDNLTLIAAATGGFMVSVALAGILHGGPVISWQSQSSVRPMTVTALRAVTNKQENVEFINDKNGNR